MIMQFSVKKRDGPARLGELVIADKKVVTPNILFINTSRFKSPDFADLVVTNQNIKTEKPTLRIMESVFSPLTGKIEDKLSKALDISLQIQEVVVDSFKSGANLKEIYDMAQQMAKKSGLGDYFMGYGKDKVKFLGHGVGLELDELPVIAEGYDFTLEENMTVAIEPKFLFPKVGAVGVENTWASKVGGPEKITDIEGVLI